MNVKYPIALDPDHEVWQAFSNRYWLAHRDLRRRCPPGPEARNSAGGRYDAHDLVNALQAIDSRPGRVRAGAVSS